MSNDSDYPTDLRPLLPCVRAVSGALADGDPDAMEDIAQEMFLRILEVRAAKPDASDAYLRGAARNRGREFATRKLHDGPRNRVTQRVDLGRMCEYDEHEVAYHYSASLTGKPEKMHIARRGHSGERSESGGGV